MPPLGLPTKATGERAAGGGGCDGGEASLQPRAWSVVKESCMHVRLASALWWDQRCGDERAFERKKKKKLERTSQPIPRTALADRLAAAAVALQTEKAQHAHIRTIALPTRFATTPCALLSTPPLPLGRFSAARLSAAPLLACADIVGARLSRG